MDLLNINNLSMNYHSLKGETKALDNINFSVKENEFLTILGPSGCGKSTLLNILCGILKPSCGSILFKGEDINKNLNKIGYMFQKDHLFEWDTVWENVTLPLRIKSLINKENLKRVNDLLEKYDLINFKNHYPKELSGGMRQRVALIRTLAINPDVLFLDEPFSALDFQTRIKVSDDIKNIINNEKKTAIMVTHDISEAISLSDRIIILSKRPANIKKDVVIDFSNKTATPFERRSEEEFKAYFDTLWKELNSK